ncbi:MAG: HD domain-containing protein [Chitinophagales bacterium]|nr:HD domain-containing protein [Chitinophagales bacterium]
MQRLSRIKQLGLTYLVYPGAQHSRLQHALGSMHLMNQTLEILRYKGVVVSAEEAEAVTVAILLHDAGHGPFSHTLERILVEGISHEILTVEIMQLLNREFDQQLSLAIEIFKGNYKKKYLHQLVSSQLDMDRLDYLNRDSFFSGVAEGIIGYDRIIKMLTVRDNELLVESKGIYSIEKFLISRRLMYWQVYLHKTVLAAEQMLIKVIQRAKEISAIRKLSATGTLNYFLEKRFKSETPEQILLPFGDLDDSDIISSMKMWRYDDDKILSWLSGNLLSRKLFRVELRDKSINEEEILILKKQLKHVSNLKEDELDYLVFSESTSNHAYSPDSGAINILYNDGSIKDITTASDLPNILALEQPVIKYFLCYPKELKNNPDIAIAL